MSHLPTPVATPLSLQTVRDILRDATATADQMDGQPVTTERQSLAAQSRTLLHLADQLQLAAGVVRNEYWYTKGLTSYDL